MNSTGIGHEETVNVEKIPDSIPRGNFKSAKFHGKPTIISFDLETTGLSELSFLQISIYT
jgi:hypothetical protein